MNKVIYSKKRSREQFPNVKLSVKNEARYIKMEEDFRLGKNVKSANSVDEFLKELKS